MSDTNNTYTKKQAAKLLDLKESTLDTYIYSGVLHRRGKRVTADSVHAYMEKRNENMSRAARKPAPRVQVNRDLLRGEVIKRTYILEGMMLAGASEHTLREYLSEMREKVLA